MITLPRPSARTLLLVLVAVVVVGALAGGGWYWLSVQQSRTTAAYADALVRAQAGRRPQSTPEARTAAARELEGVLQRYPSAPMAPQAAYELASIRYAERQYGAARAAYEIAASPSAPTTVRTLARLGIAYTWEAERNYSKAIEAFQAALASSTSSDFMFEEVLYDLGVAQELAGRKDDAIKTYRRILKDVARTRRSEEVRARLASLGVTPDEPPAPSASR
jgi:tetratricopeptide (TPR) repeat protein